ncbi:hypothetical protein Pan241w_07680 [Gimesia alba]|uniref:Uncharacterized protein n=1 Tax=Gimesia alba TaxID=2527973 RepID=A0A517R9Z6_9PLAN|nr:hypothetical protein Pan241w_07680 [Gimesia alba]
MCSYTIQIAGKLHKKKVRSGGDGALRTGMLMEPKRLWFLEHLIHLNASSFFFSITNEQ